VLTPDQINASQFVRVETISKRMVTLFFVEGIDEKAVQKTPNSQIEVNERSWIPVQDYIQETLKQNNVDYALG